MWLERGGKLSGHQGGCSREKASPTVDVALVGDNPGSPGCLPARAADLLDRVKDQEINQVLRLRVGRSKVLRTPFALTRISVADPESPTHLISDQEIYVNALAPG